MKSRTSHVRMATLAGSVVAFTALVSVAYAYPIAETSVPPTPISSFSFNQGLENLITPFENFIQSFMTQENTTINIHGVVPTPTTPTSMPDIVSYLTQALVVVLNGLSWIFGFLKQGVDWLRSLVH